jgi:CHAT domain-containing protein
LYAGTKNIIVSLWQVSDASTCKLMVYFYSNLFKNNQSTYGEPLRQAKLKMINSGEAFSHPFFWSPFILIGK